MQVLILFGFLAAMGGLFLLVAVFFWWVMRQIAHAQKYRQLKALVAEAESAMGIAPMNVAERRRRKPRPSA